MVKEIGLCLWITNKAKFVLRESLNGGLADRAMCEAMKLKFGLLGESKILELPESWYTSEKIC